MQFTIPGATSSEHAFKVFRGVKKYMNSKGFLPYNKAISKIEYSHNGKTGIAEVNQVSGINEEMVILIFECENLFLICTPARGVAGGDPIVVSRKDVIQIIYFDDLPVI